MRNSGQITFVVIGFLLMQPVIVRATGEESILPNSDTSLVTYTSGEFGFTFQYPSEFVIGAYKVEIVPVDEKTRKTLEDFGERPEEYEQPFRHAIALVEPKLLGDTPVDAIPIGQVSGITIHPHVGKRAVFLVNAFHQEQFQMTIGNQVVSRLPGYPGPYGDNAYYYLHPVDADLTIEWYAHKQRFSYLTQTSAESEIDSGYDKLIEQIIETFKAEKPVGSVFAEKDLGL